MERKLVKITEAAKGAKRYGTNKPLTRQTVRIWAKRGSIFYKEEHGLILVDPEEVKAYAATERPAGRPKGGRDHPNVPGEITPDLAEQYRLAKEKTGESDDVALADAIQGYVDRANRKKKK